MASAMERLLQSWGIEEDVIDTLKANKLTVPLLETLSDDDLRELIPLLGPRNHLKSKIKLLDKPPSSNVPDGSGAVNVNQGLSISDEPTSDEPSSDEPATSATCSVTLHSDEEDSDENESPPRSHHTSPSPGTYDLQKVLQGTTKGKMVLHYFKMYKKLNDASRTKLAECIVNNEVKGDYDKRLTADRANVLAQKVVNAFPTEVLSTWVKVVPRPNGEGKTVKGRIMIRYYTQRRTLIKAGMLDSSHHSEDENEAFDDDDPEACDESMAWLKSKNISPWTRVLTAWSATSKARLRNLQKPQPEPLQETPSQRGRGKKVTKRAKPTRAVEVKVNSYVCDYPQIKSPLGWSLLELDFESYQSQSVLKLSVEYPKLEKFVVDQLNNETLIEDTMTTNEKCACIFLSLSKLFPVTTLANNKQSGHWRPGRQEVRDSFLLHVKAMGDVKNTLEARRDQLAKFGYSNQPIAVIVGPELSSITNCLVFLDDTKYDLENPLKAIDIVFKAYHALHAYYPPESEQLWLFLKKAIYKFDTKWDRAYDRVELLVKQYQQFVV